jgi:hypothetical protein
LPPAQARSVIEAVKERASGRKLGSMIAMLRPESGCWEPSSLRLRIGVVTESRKDERFQVEPRPPPRAARVVSRRAARRERRRLKGSGSQVDAHQTRRCNGRPSPERDVCALLPHRDCRGCDPVVSGNPSPASFARFAGEP